MFVFVKSIELRHLRFSHPVVAALLMVTAGCQQSASGLSEKPQPNSTVLSSRADWAQQVTDSGSVGTFLLWEPDSNRLQASDTSRARKGFLPASTFKVFNSLVALQEVAVADEHTIIPWDSVVRQSPDWNEDQDLDQALHRSTVWFYQEVARRVGAERMQHWLDTVSYGNHSMGAAIDLFWLEGALRITPLEQVHFMERLHEEQLPFDRRHQQTVKRILAGDSTATWKLQGKSGWAIRVDEEYGWYVGWVERAGRTAYFALNIDIKNMDDVRRRYTLVYALLEREGWTDARQ
ncbi:MAG: class D beta-lactamase [Flavobacteriales bacterium]